MGTKDQIQPTEQLVPQFTDTPVVPKTNHLPTIAIVLVGILLVTGSVFAGIQIGKKQTPEKVIVPDQKIEEIKPEQTEPVYP